jgi:hypothetical protein
LDFGVPIPAHFHSQKETEAVLLERERPDQFPLARSQMKLICLTAASMLAFFAAVSFSIQPVLAKEDKNATRQAWAAADALFTNGIVRVLKIDLPNDSFKSLRRDPRNYVSATLHEDGLTYTNVLVRIKGGAGSFRPLDDKPGLTVRFDEASASFHGLNKIHLNNSVQDSTFLSEWVCSDIFRKAGVPAPRAAPMIVELNGRRLGIYVLLESVDQQFLAHYFTNTHGNVYSPSWNADITQPLECIGGRENNSRADLKALAAAARKPSTGQLPQVLDLDRFLSFVAVEVMLCHWDGYTFNVKNYLVFHDLDSQKMVFIPHDLDQMLEDPMRPALPHGVQGIVSRAVLNGSSKPYLARFTDIYNRVFVASVLNKQIDGLVAKLSPQIAAYDPDLAQEFAINAKSLKRRILDRAQSLKTQLKSSTVAAGN